MPLSDLWRDMDANTDAPDAAEVARNQKRTEKARTAALHAHYQRKLEAAGAASAKSAREELAPSTHAGILQAAYFTDTLFNPGPSSKVDYQKQGAERARCAFSLLKVIVGALQTLFLGPHGNPDDVGHIINTVVADDTDTRMVGPGLRSTLYTICNTFQCVHVRNKPCDDPNQKQPSWETLAVPTPLLVLAAPKTGNIHAAITAFSSVCGVGVGPMLQDLGVTRPRVSRSTFQTEILMGDALKANDAAWKLEQSLLAKRRASGEPRMLGLRMKCLIHQLNLIRKPSVLSLPAYWTTLVRLGHLFEAFSFRKAFAAALLQHLQAPQVFQSAQAEI